MRTEPSSRNEEIRSTARSRQGVDFDPRLAVWNFRSGVDQLQIDFELLRGAQEPLSGSIRSLLLWYVENKSASLANNTFQRILHFLRWRQSVNADGIGEIGAADLLGYRSSLNDWEQWYLTLLAGAFRKLEALGYAGVSKEASDLLRKLKLRGNRKGEAVRTACPISGPLTDIEFTGVVTALTAAREAKQLSSEQFLMGWLCIGLGLRTIQIASLKVCDLVPARDGQPAVLRVPRAKQRSQLHRSEFKERPLVPAFAAAFLQHIHDIGQRLGPAECPDGAPMFPNIGEATWSPGFEWHATSNEIYRRARAGLESMEVRSERTGLPLRLNPTRFRRTLGTRAAAEGRGKMVIAEMLDHSDLQNVDVYTEARPDIVDRLSEMMASAMAPLARAFAGEIGDSEAGVEAPGGRIADPRFGSRKPLGSCGSSGVCRLLAPAGCYTCPSFRAWRDGPHQAVLDLLLEERARLERTTDQRIAAVNDRTILAVSEVISLCRDDPHG